jgi:hypothetical protein
MWSVTDAATDAGAVPVLMSAASRLVVSPNGLMPAWHARQSELSSDRVTTGTPSSTSVRIWCSFSFECGSWHEKQFGTKPACGACVPSSRSLPCSGYPRAATDVSPGTDGSGFCLPPQNSTGAVVTFRKSPGLSPACETPRAARNPNPAFAEDPGSGSTDVPLSWQRLQIPFAATTPAAVWSRRFAGFRISRVSPVEACSPPGPWHCSHPMFSST